jgi:hypothetical protein
VTSEDLKQEANNAAESYWNTPPDIQTSKRGVLRGGGIFIVPRINPSIPAPTRLVRKPAVKSLQDRFTAAGIPLPAQKPKATAEWEEYHRNYAKMVMEEAKQKFAARIFPSASPTPSSGLSDTNPEAAANRWLAAVRLHDKLNSSPLFKDKPRGHGQDDGSTDGRLRRKLVKAAIQHAIKDTPSLAANVASMLNGFRTFSGASSALKKALFLTQEKLRTPLEYKQKYSRVVPFNDPADPDNLDKWVKASRRFYTPASAPLLLPNRSDGTTRNTTKVTMEPPPANLSNFGPDGQELIQDVGQKDLGECWLQASAASLPRSTLGNMFSWRPSYGSAGVTTRLHDEQGNPMYIRTQKDQLWNDVSEHKALWPAALATAAAKVGRNELKQFRDGIKPRDPDTGLPVYSVRDVYGNTIAAASKLLTGKAPLIDEDVSGLSPSEKKTRIGNLWTTRSPGIQNGVATFGNFNEKNGSDIGRGHAVVLQNIHSDGTGTFGNPWVDGEGAGAVGDGHKIFKVLLSRMRRLSVLPQDVDPNKDRFVAGQYPHPMEHLQTRLGNIPI